MYGTTMKISPFMLFRDNSSAFAPALITRIHTPQVFHYKTLCLADTGLFLAIHYCPNIDTKFNRVRYICRDVNYGWLLRTLHYTQCWGRFP